MFLRTRIRLNRWFDQSWRVLFGTPTTKRSRVLPNLFLGGQLYQRGAPTLKRWGVTGVVSLRRSLPKEFVKSGFKLLHLPVIEHSAPTLEQLCQGVKFIHDEIENGGTIYVHCLHGEGRGPTMVAAYLLSLGYSVEKAFENIMNIRSFISPSEAQLDKLEEFQPLANSCILKA